MVVKGIEVIDRVSTSNSKKADEVNDTYTYEKTPPPLEDGALRAGGMPNIYSKEHIGLLIQWFGAGLIYSCVYGLNYPFLNNYLRMSGVATSSVSVLTALPYTFKLFFGIISDCFPIFGYCRRPYMIIGWIVCTICCLVMAVMPIGDPYFLDPTLVNIPTANLTIEQQALINKDAPNTGYKYVLLLIVANLGLVMAFTAAGGTVVELSQREPVHLRGTTQAMVWVARDIGGIFANAIIGFGLNSSKYGGSFSGSIGVNGVMAICTVIAIASGVSAWFNITEEKKTRLSFFTEVAKIFDLIQHRVVYQILAFQFFKNMFSYISVTAAYPIQSLWAHVEPVNSNIASIIALLISSATLTVVTKFGLQWNWRWIIVAAEVGVICIDVIPTFLTVWNVVRSQWLWLGVPLLEQVPWNIGWIISTFCMVEITEEGNEAAFYGLIVSVSSLASPFSTVITKNVDAHFDIDFTHLQLDTKYVRTQVTYAYVFQYCAKLFSLIFVLLLPRQKAETHELKRTGGKSLVIGILTVLFLSFVFVWSIMTNLMSIFPSSACYVIAGGSGC